MHSLGFGSGFIFDLGSGFWAIVGLDFRFVDWTWPLSHQLQKRTGPIKRRFGLQQEAARFCGCGCKVTTSRG